MTNYPEGEGPPDIAASKARLAVEHDKPEHKFRPGQDGKDPRDERTRTDPIPKEDLDGT